MAETFKHDRERYAIAKKFARKRVRDGMQADALQSDLPHEFDDARARGGLPVRPRNTARVPGPKEIMNQATLRSVAEREP